MVRHKLPTRTELCIRIEKLEAEIMQLRQCGGSMPDHIVWMLDASETMVGACKVLMKGVTLPEA
jgi:hypothetical protein